MKTYEQVDTYMQQIGLKYVKSSNEFVAGLAIRTNKDYTQKVAAELNSRAQHSNSSNMVFYKIKNETFDGSIYISAAFDGGLFRHLGNLIIDNSELFDGKEAVDFACDCGIVTCFIAKMYPNCHITGVDVNSSAIENANILKDKLGLDNVDFVCSDVFEYNNEKKADTAVTFRALLDVCMAKTKELPFFGERMWRENQYKDAFADFVNVINNNIKPDGKVLSVERYTADYGWLFINYIEVSNTSRNAARIACVEYETVNLENGAVVSPKSYTLDDLDDDDINDETKDIIRQVKNSLPKNVDNVKINVSYSNDIEAEIENRTVKNRSSGDVTIYVECRIPVFTPILGSGADKMHYTLKSSSTFKVEKSDGA